MRIQRFFLSLPSAFYIRRNMPFFPVASGPASIVAAQRVQNYANIRTSYRLLAIAKSPAIGRYEEVYY